MLILMLSRAGHQKATGPDGNIFYASFASDLVFALSK